MLGEAPERLGEREPEPFLGAAARRVFERSEWQRLDKGKSGGRNNLSLPVRLRVFGGRSLWFRGTRSIGAGVTSCVFRSRAT